MCTRQRSGEEPSCQAGDRGDVVTIPGPGRSPGKGNCNLFQYFCLESSSGQKSLADYSPWGREESETTEHIHNT